MKRSLTLIAIAFSLSSYAQVVDPLSQFFNSSFIPNIVEHDSITISADSGSQFSAIAAGYQHYFVNGKIDTLTISQAGNVVAFYKGKVSSDLRHTTITGYNLMQNDSIDKIVFTQDKMYRDSVVSYFEYQNGTFIKFFEARINRNANGLSSVIDIYADPGTGPVKVGDYQYFYNQNLLDSLYYTISFGGQNDGYLKYYYDPATPGKLLTVDTYEDMNNDGEKDLVRRFICKNNAQNEVIEITELAADNNFNLLLSGAFRYDVQRNSSISLKEVTANKISLYPNPASDYLFLEYNAEELNTYKVIDINGKVVLQGLLSKQLKISNLKKGVYQIIMEGKINVSTTFIKD